MDSTVTISSPLLPSSTLQVTARPFTPSSTLSPSVINDSMVYYNTHLMFMRKSVVPVYDMLTLTLMVMGLVGNVLGLLTLICSSKLQTSHFVFYKVLTVAELSYCAEYFADKLVVFLFADPQPDRYYYDNSFAAFHQIVLRRFVYSLTSYVVLYMTVLISIDRFVAVWFGATYQMARNKTRLSWLACLTCVLLATTFNSWDAFLESSYDCVRESQRMVVNHFNDTVTADDVCASPVRFVIIPRTSPHSYLTAKKVKNFYNMGIRLFYPLILLFFTSGVIWGFLKFRQRRVSMSCRRESMADRRKEQHLYYLLAAVVILALIQVTPREIKRYVDLQLNQRGIIDLLNRKMNLLAESRVYALIKRYFFIEWLTILANLGTQIDRSFKFYLYLILNSRFRTEFIHFFFGQYSERCHWCKKICVDTGKYARSRRIKYVNPPRIEFTNSAVTQSMMLDTTVSTAGHDMVISNVHTMAEEQLL